MEQAVLSVASTAFTNCWRIRGFSLPEAEHSGFGRAPVSALLTSSYSLAGLAFAFVFQHSAGGGTLLWEQSRRFSVCGAGQGEAEGSRMCLPGERHKRGSLLLSQEGGRAEPSM